MKVLIGQISEISRYPIKSFAGEALETCAVDTYGLYGDRFCAFRDETKQGWDSYITARDIPNLLGYKAKLVDGEICVRSPDGKNYGWNEDLLREIQTYSKRTISMTRYKAPNLENPDLMAVDMASLLIITDESLRNLEALCGKGIDESRFRSNLVVTLADSTIREDDWIGNRLAIGSTEFQVDNSCERCSMITIDPHTLERDSSLLKKVSEELNMNFGVYASVRKTGQIQVGDRVYLIR